MIDTNKVFTNIVGCFRFDDLTDGSFFAFQSNRCSIFSENDLFIKIDRESAFLVVPNSCAPFSRMIQIDKKMKELPIVPYFDIEIIAK